MPIFKLIVRKRDPKKLGRFLLKHNFSHQSLIKARHQGGGLWVNHKSRYLSFHLRTGDEIIFLTAKEKVNPWLHPINRPLNILKETDNYLIVDKPAGLLSIPSRYEDSDSLVNRALAYFGKLQGQLKPHVITRLDRNTSGLVVIGKNAIAQARFSHLPKTEFVKRYHALVHGNFTKGLLSGLINQPIGRPGKGVKRAIMQSGKPASTYYRVLCQQPGVSYLQLRLLTGRTHQIRVHLSFLGHPLLGDHLYGAQDSFSHQALHCYELNFIDPFEKKRVRIAIQDPIEFCQWWRDFK